MDEGFFDHQLVGNIYGGSVSSVQQSGFLNVDARKYSQRLSDVSSQALELEFIFGHGVPLHVILAGGSPEKGIADGSVGLLRIGFERLEPRPHGGIGKVDGGGAVEDHAEGVDSRGTPGGFGRTRIEEGRKVGCEARQLIVQIVLTA